MNQEGPRDQHELISKKPPKYRRFRRRYVTFVNKFVRTHTHFTKDPKGFIFCSLYPFYQTVYMTKFNRAFTFADGHQRIDKG